MINHPAAKHSPKFTLFSTSELCGTDEGSKSTSFHSKGRSREFIQFIYSFSKAFMHPLRSSLGTFCGKTCEACLNAEQKNVQEMKKFLPMPGIRAGKVVLKRQQR